MPFHDLREWLSAMESLSELRLFEDVDQDFEIGVLTELAAEAKGPALLFDRIKGFPSGYRVTSNLFRGHKRLLATLEMPPNLIPAQALRRWKEVVSGFRPVPPVEVDSGPVFENFMSEKEVDLSKFPAPIWHELDGGNYIGTGDLVIVRDPDSNWINLGSYRLMNHDRNSAGIFIQVVRHGYAIARKYWNKGRPCPVAVSLGNDPLLLLAAGDTVARTAERVSEYAFAGYIRGKPVEVVPGKLTGLPVPATAEVVLEGEILPPEQEQRLEGPFGEYLGYYAHGRMPEPVVKIRAVSYRSDPILIGKPPLKPTFGGRTSIPLSLANMWNRLERGGISGIQDMRTISGYSALAISLRQESDDHVGRLIKELGKMEGGQRLTIIVDDDIDLDDPRDVIWAVGTRSDLKSGTYFFTGHSSDQLDPMMPAEVREKKGAFEYTRIVINSCRPYKKDFPAVCVFGPQWREKIRAKWGDGLFSARGS